MMRSMTTHPCQERQAVGLAEPVTELIMTD